MTLPPFAHDHHGKALSAHIGIIVDDEPEVRALFAEVCRRAGMQVRQAGSGYRALDLARAQVPDFIVTDIEMPDCDGLELCRRLRTDPDLHQIRIVVVSGVAAVEGEAAVAAGCDAVLEKPCHPALLVDTIRQVLALRPHYARLTHPAVSPAAGLPSRPLPRSSAGRPGRTS